MMQDVKSTQPGRDERAGSGKTHCLLFVGHMIDQPGRKVPRFPPSLAGTVREAIAEAVKEEQKRVHAPLRALAGGACGGDLLFHEACEEAGVSSELFLALPRDEYVAHSVRFAGPEWVEKFDRLYKKLDSEVLADKKGLPGTRGENAVLSIWEQTNIRMLDKAMEQGGQNMTLLALWDKKGGDGPGGTQHMVAEARLRGARVRIIDIRELLAAASE